MLHLFLEHKIYLRVVFISANWFIDLINGLKTYSCFFFSKSQFLSYILSPFSSNLSSKNTDLSIALLLSIKSLAPISYHETVISSKQYFFTSILKSLSSRSATAVTYYYSFKYCLTYYYLSMSQSPSLLFTLFQTNNQCYLLFYLSKVLPLPILCLHFYLFCIYAYISISCFKCMLKFHYKEDYSFSSLLFPLISINFYISCLSIYVPISYFRYI